MLVKVINRWPLIPVIVVLVLVFLGLVWQNHHSYIKPTAVKDGSLSVSQAVPEILGGNTYSSDVPPSTTPSLQTNSADPTQSPINSLQTNVSSSDPRVQAFITGMGQ
ncbi:MAG: hypothetical protein ACYCPS_04170 [Candidatus Saccharimonadales bacterium]